MTQEQKEQLAKEYAENEYKIGDAAYDKAMANLIERVYLDALDARDEEFALLKAEIEDDNAVMMQLRAELAKAKNPWVSVEERLPETKRCVNPIERSDLVLIRRKGDRYPMRAWYWNDGKFTSADVDGTPKNSISEIDKSEVAAWMPIPEGGEQ